MNPRAFVDFPIELGEVYTVSGEDGHHFSRVLRLRAGERLDLASGGNGYHGEITLVDGKAGTVGVRISEKLPSHEPTVRLYLAQALPKGDKLDDILQHGTEAGFAGYLLFPSARSVVRLETKKLSNRLERWARIVKEAASQAQRDVIPSVDYVGGVKDVPSWLERTGMDGVLFLDENEDKNTLQSVLENYPKSSKLLLCIGPEGGWDDIERTYFAGQLRGRTITLGPRILRTETAGLVAGAATLYHYGAMGGE